MKNTECIDLKLVSAPSTPVGGAKLSERLQKRLEWYGAGEKTLLGLPFLFHANPATSATGIRLQPGLDAALSIPIGRCAKWLLFIHDAEIGCGEYTEPVGRYILHRKGHPDVEKVIRYGIEIPAHDGECFNLATFDTRPIELAGPQDDWFTQQQGFRFSLFNPTPSHRIFVWENPEPAVPVTSLECVNTGRSPIIISAITLNNEPEHPIRIIPRTTLAIEFPELDNLKISDVNITIDRGMVVRVEPLRPVADDFFNSPQVGWGVASSVFSKSLRAEIYGPHCARISIDTPSGIAASAKLGEALETAGKQLAEGKIHIQMLHPEKTWVHAKVVDAETGRPVPARIHLRGQRGEYIPPAGHHRDVNTRTNEMIGTDVCIAGTNYAYVDGTFQADLPVGKIFAEVARGLEYIPNRVELDIKPGQHELTIPIKRLLKMSDKGYYSGDTHVHFVTTQGGLLEAGGEDLNVLNILITQWGKLYTSFSQFSGAPSTVSTDEHIIYVNQENRQHVLGHINLLGLKKPIFPVCTDGPSESWLGDALEASIADWADETHRQGGIVVHPHFCRMFNEYIPDSLLGKLDATEIGPWTLTGRAFLHQAYGNWYRILNCGVRMPIVGGTDKMTDAAVVGGCRTYAHIPGGDTLTYDRWCNAIRQGNTFMTTGPMLFLEVEGLPPGATIPLPGNGGLVEFRVSSIGYFPLKSIELIHNGRVIAVVTPEGRGETAEGVECGMACSAPGQSNMKGPWFHGVCDMQMWGKVPINKSGWLAARCSGREDVPGPRGIVAAHTSAVYIEVGGKAPFNASDAHFMLETMDEMLAWADQIAVYRSPQKKRNLMEIFAAGKKILHDRLHQHEGENHSHGHWTHSH